MAQYNLVGYNASPTNVEYEQAKAAWDRTPRTNWAEFALREEQLKEQKKSNRIKNVLDVVNTAATAVNTYENVLNSELQRDSQKLINQERTLDIQTKQIDVNKKITETEADLAYTTKLREFQKAGDYASGLQLMLYSPEAAFRNSPQTKSFIEESRFKHTPNVEETYTAIFPDEAYKHKQDDLNRQTQLQVANIHEAGATRRAQMQIDANAPLREAQIASYNALAAKRIAEANFGMDGFGMGTSMADMKKLHTAFDQANLSAYTAIADDDALSTLNYGNYKKTLENFANGGIKEVDLNNTENVAKFIAHINATLNGGVSTSGAINSLLTNYGKGSEGIDAEGIANWREANKKSRLVEYVDDTGATSYYIVDKATLNAINKSMTTGTELYSKNIIAQVQHTGGDLSKLNPYQLEALSRQSSTILNELNEQYNGNLLSTATPRQKTTNAFQSLAANLQQSVQQMSAPNAQESEIPSKNIQTVTEEGARLPEEDLSARSKQAVNTAAPNVKEWLADIGMTNASVKGVSYQELSPEEQQMYAQQGYEFLENTKRKDIATQDRVALTKEPLDRKVQSMINQQIHTKTPDEDFVDTIKKYNNTALNNVRKTSAKDTDTLNTSVNNFYNKEIDTLTTQLGNLLDTYNVSTVIDMRYRLENSEDVKNYVSYRFREGGSIAHEDRYGKHYGDPYSEREKLIHNLAEAIDRAITTIKSKE